MYVNCFQTVFYSGQRRTDFTLRFRLQEVLFFSQIGRIPTESTTNITSIILGNSGHFWDILQGCKGKRLPTDDQS